MTDQKLTTTVTQPGELRNTFVGFVNGCTKCVDFNQGIAGKECKCGQCVFHRNEKNEVCLGDFEGASVAKWKSSWNLSVSKSTTQILSSVAKENIYRWLITLIDFLNIFYFRAFFPQMVDIAFWIFFFFFVFSQTPNSLPRSNLLLQWMSAFLIPLMDFLFISAL